MLLTVHQVAAREKVSAKRIHALVRQGRVTGVGHHGNALAFPENYTILPPPSRPGRKRRAQAA